MPGPLTGLLSPDVQRSGLLPVGRNRKTGLLEFALPEAVVGLLGGIEMPGQAMRGEVNVMDPNTGHASPEAIARMADLAGMVTLGAGAMPAERGALRAGIKAYHGSPHDFEKFSMDKIGTGEGAQAYGHGLYFAENKGTARSYRDALTGRVSDSASPAGAAERALAAANGDKKAAIETLRANMKAMKGMPREQEYADAIALVEKGYQPGGRMYEVNINANPEDFLNWDAPITEAPKAFQDWAKSKMDSVDLPEGSRRQRMLQAWRGAPGDWQPPEGANIPPPRVAEVRNWLANYGEDQASMTDELRKAGIPGIKYLDQGSRGAAEKATHNYVVFDDKLIEIVKKYGIVGAVAAGMLTKEQGKAMAAQGYPMQSPQQTGGLLSGGGGY